MKKTKSRRTYRFFFHYYKQKGKMSVHFRGACSVVDNVQCLVTCCSKYNTRQPRLVMQGYAREVIIPRGSKTATII